MKPSKNIILLHLIVLIFGLTGVLGKLISADEVVIVFYRLMFAIIGILIYLKLTKFSIDLSKKAFKEVGYVGILVGVHWLTFFGSIKLSNVSVALICFSSSTFFTSLLEPLYFRKKPNWQEVILGILIMVGIFYVCKEPNKSFFDSKYLPGMLLSVFSAFLASWFTVANGLLIKKGRRAKNISLVQLMVAFGLVLIVIVGTITTKENVSYIYVSSKDLIYCLILGLLCTSFAYIASVEVMKEVSPYTVSMSVNLEPIYSIILATIIWPDTEEMSPTFYLGAAIIMTIILLNGLLKMRLRRTTASSTP